MIFRWFFGKTVFWWFSELQNRWKISFFQKINEKSQKFRKTTFMYFLYSWDGTGLLCANFQILTPTFSISKSEKLFRFSRKEIPLEFLAAGTLTTVGASLCQPYKGITLWTFFATVVYRWIRCKVVCFTILDAICPKTGNSPHSGQFEIGWLRSRPWTGLESGASNREILSWNLRY